MELPLPDFLIGFKDTCMQAIVPQLLSLIHELEKSGPNNPTLDVLSAIFFLLLIKSVASNLFTFKPPQLRLTSQEEVDNEVDLLTKEIRKMKNSLKKIVEENSSGDISVKTSHNSSQGYNSADV